MKTLIVSRIEKLMGVDGPDLSTTEKIFRKGSRYESVGVFLHKCAGFSTETKSSQKVINKSVWADYSDVIVGLSEDQLLDLYELVIRRWAVQR